MNGINRFFRGSAAWLLSFSLFMLAAAAALMMTVLNAGYIKSALVANGTYDHILSSTLNLATIPVNTGATTTQLDPNTVKELEPVIASAVTPAFIRSIFEPVIDGTFVWLKGEAALPNFSIDAAGVRSALQTNLTAYINKRLAALPVCTNISQVVSLDPLTTSCRPPVDISQSEVQSSVADFIDSLPLLQNDVISSQTLNIAQNFAADKPAYHLPLVYQIAIKLPYLFAVLALASATTVIILSKPRFTAWKTVGHTFFWAGVLLAATGALTLVLLYNTTPGFFGSSSKQQLDFANTIFTPLINTLSKSLAQYSLYFGGAYALIGAVCYLIAHRLRLKHIQIEPGR